MKYQTLQMNIKHMINKLKTLQILDIYYECEKKLGNYKWNPKQI